MMLVMCEKGVFSIFLQIVKSTFCDTHRVDRGGQDESNDVSNMCWCGSEKLSNGVITG